MNGCVLINVKRCVKWYKNTWEMLKIWNAVCIIPSTKTKFAFGKPILRKCSRPWKICKSSKNVVNTCEIASPWKEECQRWKNNGNAAWTCGNKSWILLSYLQMLSRHAALITSAQRYKIAGWKCNKWTKNLICSFRRWENNSQDFGLFLMISSSRCTLVKILNCVWRCALKEYGLWRWIKHKI